MAAVSPVLKAGLGLAAAAAAFTLWNGSGDNDVVLGETFDSPLAMVDESTTTATTWQSPPVTRNPFEAGGLVVDPEAVEELTVETTETTAIDPATTLDDTPGTTTTSAGVVTTQATETLEQTVTRRIPAAGLPTDTTVPGGEATNGTSTTGPATIQLEG
ncbi:MAG: hypothetical protein R2710_03275 [Acidimicrobiales bacterium]